jgi:hypothetical protein
MTREGRYVLLVAAATAITRWLALARTFWDADEARFILALRHYDVTIHQPHPPGFPLFIATAKLFQWTGLSDVHALQAINFIAAVLIVPVAYAFARSLDFSFTTSLAAAALLAFFPNVWIYGGSAFSDVPAMVLVSGAATLLLRGRIEWGALVAAIAIGYRPQNLIVVGVVAIATAIRLPLTRPSATLSPLPRGEGHIGLLPASGEKVREARMRGVVIFALIAIAAYGAAAYFSGGWSAYRDALRTHEHFIAQTDSFHAPGRPPLLYVMADFLVRPYRQPLINAIVTLLALAGGIGAIVRPRAGRWIAIASFAPIAILATLYLDWMSASRFAIGFAPLVALMAADGAAIIARRFAPLIVAALIAVMIAWAWPAVRIAHTTVAPPVAAAAALPRDRNICVDTRLAPHAAVLLAKWEPVDVTALPLQRDDRCVLFAEDASGAATAKNFMRSGSPLAQIVRQRYFETTVVPLSDVAKLRGNVLLLPPLGGDGQLTLEFDAPAATVRFNGRELAPQLGNIRRYRVLSRTHGDNELQVDGGRIKTFGWIPAF